MDKRIWSGFKMTAILLVTSMVIIQGLMSIFGTWTDNIKTFEESDEVLMNPLIGYAPNADSDHASAEEEEKATLLYLDITWRELEPEEGIYDWEKIASTNQLDRWKQEGKHLVLRFICDIPGDTVHMDIPDWLYKKTGEQGTWYDMEYGKGFSPDYSQENFIRCHAAAVKAMGEYLGQDTFVSYIELGSLGHWGEWHVNYGAGIERLPKAKVREKYVTPWVETFPEAKILMRRPFQTAQTHGFGLYNDMAGEPESTKEWLDWIQYGGEYGQTGEKSALVAMVDAWKQAPIGGEFTSSLSMEELLEEDLSQTLKLIRNSHTTFLGPKTANPKYETGYNEVLKNLGYRFWISSANLKTRKLKSSVAELSLVWENSGCAPIYWDWQVYIYVFDAENEILAEFPVEINLTELLPGTQIHTDTELAMLDIDKWKEEGMQIAVAIIDPMTGEPAVKLAMKGEEEKSIIPLF